MRNNLLYILYSLIFIIAGIQLYQTNSLNPADIGCNISELINCSKVMNSQFSKFLGQPLSFFVMIWASLGFSFVLINKHSNKLKLIFLLNSWGLFCSLITLIIMLFIIKSICLYCIIIDLLIVISWIVSFNYRKSPINWGFIKYVGLGSVTIMIMSLITLKYFINNIKFEKKIQHPQTHVKMNNTLLRKSVLILGNPLGGKIITEFTDFQCPACKQSFLILEELIKKDSNIKVILKNFPLSNVCNKYVKQNMHSWSCISSYLAVCAQKQNKFLDFFNAVYKNQENIKNPPDLIPILERTGLNMPELLKCSNDPDTSKYIELDIEEGNNLGIEGTPAIFYKNEKIELWSSEFVFEQLLKN